MKVNLRPIHDRSWVQGWVLDKHTEKSTLVGRDANGRPRFETLRTEVGEATYQLKYRRDLSQAARLAEAIAIHVCPRFEHVGFIVPMPASTPRPRQPVTEVAMALGRRVNRPASDQILQKRGSGQSMKNLQAKQDKAAALGSFQRPAFRMKSSLTVKAGPPRGRPLRDRSDDGSRRRHAQGIVQGERRLRRGAGSFRGSGSPSSSCSTSGRS